MATIQGYSSRKGAVKTPSQIFNSSTGHYIKRDFSSGQFLSAKKDGEPFKGVRIEKILAQPNPNFKKSTAKKVEKAVVAVLNKKEKK